MRRVSRNSSGASAFGSPAAKVDRDLEQDLLHGVLDVFPVTQHSHGKAANSTLNRPRQLLAHRAAPTALAADCCVEVASSAVPSSSRPILRRCRPRQCRSRDRSVRTKPGRLISPDGRRFVSARLQRPSRGPSFARTAQQCARHRRPAPRTGSHRTPPRARPALAGDESSPATARTTRCAVRGGRPASWIGASLPQPGIGFGGAAGGDSERQYSQLAVNR